MRIAESRLRKLIRQTLIEEGFWGNITDPKKWNQFKKSVGHSAKKHGFSEGELGEGLDYEGYLTYVFGENDYVNQLTETLDKLKYGQLSEDNVLRTLRTISYDALCEYMGVIDHSVINHRMAKMTFDRLFQISVRQLASSVKYFNHGGIEEVLRMRKKDLEMEFNRSIPIVVKMCNA